MTVTIVKGGSLTTIQDGGRLHYRHLGVPPSGAMDRGAAQAANYLVGNDPNRAVMEFTVIGPTLHFARDTMIAITGGHFISRAANGDVAANRTIVVAAGTTLEVGPSVAGTRGYLAVAGGWRVPEILGSRSTFLKGGWGGYEGRALKVGDEFSTATATLTKLRALKANSLACHRPVSVLRFIPGPQWATFSKAARDTFSADEYRVTQQADRMGIRITGAVLDKDTRADIAPEGTVPGAVQVPADGQPIILGVDLPSTGGYRKIATIIGADQPYLAYAQPGDRVHFMPVTLAEARDAWASSQAALLHCWEEIG